MKNLFLIFVISMSLWSCTSMRNYAERVFKYQNQVLAELMNVITNFEENDNPAVEKLYVYEDEINEICRPIQKTALTRLAGREVTFGEGYDASIIMKACYDKTIEVRQHLKGSGLWMGQFSEVM